MNAFRQTHEHTHSHTHTVIHTQTHIYYFHIFVLPFFALDQFCDLSVDGSSAWLSLSSRSWSSLGLCNDPTHRGNNSRTLDRLLLLWKVCHFYFVSEGNVTHP